jgi:hypothetical protein
MGSARKVASNADDRKGRASGLFGKHLHPFALKSCCEITLDRCQKLSMKSSGLLIAPYSLA